jgi:hypothetical protein
VATIGIVSVAGVRQWANGTFAASANAYRNPNSPYSYTGNTGSGVYRINVDGTLIDTWCDMTTESGFGWTLVLLNSQYPVPPKPTWNQVVNNANLTGVIQDGLSAFDFFMGVRFWNSLGTKLRIEAGNSVDAILRRAQYDFSLNASNFYSLNLSNQLIQIGGVVPGIYTYHNAMKLSTYDLDNDTYTGSCSANYNNTAWWYTNCWSGSFWGGGGSASFTNNPYWYGSADARGDTWFPWGAIWIR